MNIIKTIINVIKSIFVKPQPTPAPAKKYSQASYGSGKYNK